MARIILFDDRQKTLHASFQNSRRETHRLQAAGKAAPPSIEWTAEPEGVVELSPSKDGTHCTVTPVEIGIASVEVVAEDEQGEMKDYVQVEVRERSASRLRIDDSSEDEPLAANKLRERNARLSARRQEEEAQARGEAEEPEGEEEVGGEAEAGEEEQQEDQQERPARRAQRRGGGRKRGR